MVDFSYSTFYEACKCLGSKTNTELDMFILGFNLPHSISDTSKGGKINQLIFFGKNCPKYDIETQNEYGGSFFHEVIRRVVEEQQVSKEFENSLAKDGFSIYKNADGFFELKRMYPELANLNLVEVDDEIDNLLKKNKFNVAFKNSKQMIDNYSQGNWEAANGQMRTFLDEIFESIFLKITESEKKHDLKDCYKELSKKGFLLKDRKETEYIEGLYKLMNTKGAHVGLSDEEDSTFRLHIVLITARLFLRRYVEQSKEIKNTIEDVPW